MQFIQGYNRNQTTFTTLDDQVEADNPVRLMDAFVDKLNLIKLALAKLYTLFCAEVSCLRTWLCYEDPSGTGHVIAQHPSSL
jgi:hypothetical protein